MRKRLGAFIVAFMLCFGLISLSSCDFGIYDVKDDEGFFDGIDILELLGDTDLKDLLDTKTCYEDLLKELRFMIDGNCYKSELLAGSQAYTIMISYGIADMSVNPSGLTNDVLSIKAHLFASIKAINLYANNYSLGIINMFSETELFNATNTAIILCSNLIEVFKTSEVE